MEKPKFTVIPDTNILWADEKTDCVAPAFQEFWEEFSKAADFALLVPEVVLGELKYQHFESARKALNAARQQLDRLSSITGNQRRTRITEEGIRKQIESKFQRWLKKIGASEIPIPTSTIDIQELAQLAVWRKGVFAPDAKTPDAEKGFRDALILESVAEYVRSEPSKRVAFLCNDNLLRTSTLAILKAHPNLQCFESLEQFGSQIRLLSANLTQHFVKQISTRATARFFVPNDSSTLFYSADVKGVIRERFKDEFGLSREDIGGRLFSTWHELPHGKWIISPPSFVEIQDGNKYHWKSLVRTAIQFALRMQARTVLGNTDMSSKTLFLVFAVYWKARVRSDGHLRTAELVDIKLDNREFRDASQQELERYNLVVPQPAPPSSPQGDDS